MHEALLERILAKYERLMAERKRARDHRSRFSLLHDIGTQIAAFKFYGGGDLPFPARPRRKWRRMTGSEADAPTRPVSPEEPSTYLSALGVGGLH
jgi:hypothetical protein